MSAESWEPVASTADIVPGEIYRARVSVRAAYTSANVALLKLGWRARLSGKPFEIIGFDHAAPLYSAHGTGFAPWPFNVRLKAKATDPNAYTQAGLDPRGLLALAALVVTVAFAIYVSEAKLERLVSTTFDKFKGAAKEIINPGLVLSLLVAFIFYVKGRKA